MPEPSLEDRVNDLTGRVDHLTEMVGNQQFELERRASRLESQDAELGRLRQVIVGIAAIAATAQLAPAVRRLDDVVDLHPPGVHASTAER